MPTEFFIHKMTEHMETARIVRWYVREGDAVQQYQPLLEAETDKAVVDVEAPAAGVIRGIRAGAEDGAEVRVGVTLCYIAAPGEDVPALPPLGEERAAAGNASRPASTVHAAPSPTRSGSNEAAPAGGDVRATPAARRVARELGVDLRAVKGRGPGGIIREEDVRDMR